jgi:hypothetical protein
MLSESDDGARASCEPMCGRTAGVAGGAVLFVDACFAYLEHVDVASSCCDYSGLCAWWRIRGALAEVSCLRRCEPRLSISDAWMRYRRSGQWLCLLLSVCAYRYACASVALIVS